MRAGATMIGLAAAVLLMGQQAKSLPTCNPATVEVTGNGPDKMVFAVIGDWGRQAADLSMFNNYTVNLCASQGQCCSSLQNNNYPAAFDSGDYGYAGQQLLAASLLDEVCGKVGCSFIAGMGDNFYPCGADAPESGLNRFESDWVTVYGASSTSNLANLTWYQIVGNHDIGFDSVARQVAYTKNNSRWQLPSAYHATLFQAQDVSVQLVQLDANPFMASYAYPEPNVAYYHPEFINSSVPSYLNSEASAYVNASTGTCTVPPANASFISNFSDNATGQIPWLKSCLNSSTATWNIVNGHYPLWGSDVSYANPAPNSTKKSLYPGMCGAWGSVMDLVSQYNVSLYLNGHDHTGTHADPNHAGIAAGNATLLGNGNGASTYYVSPPSTQFFTLGNGGIIQYGDGVTLESPKAYNNFSDVIYNINDEGTPGEGFAIITATPCNITVNMYGVVNYVAKTTPLHTVVIDKCGLANPLGANPAPVAAAPEPATLTAAG